MVKRAMRVKTARAARRRGTARDAREEGADAGRGAAGPSGRPLARALERKAAKRARFLSSAWMRTEGGGLARAWAGVERADGSEEGVD